MEVLANPFLLLWHTWNMRNKVIHDGASPFIGSSVVFLTRYMNSLLLIRQQGDLMDIKGKHSLGKSVASTSGPAARPVLKRWKPPPQGTLKINVDAAFNHLDGEAALGVVIRDWEGNLKLTGWRVILHCRDAEEAEAIARREGVLGSSNVQSIFPCKINDCVITLACSALLV
jgi:hypothetical protein